MARKLPWSTQRKANPPSQGSQENIETGKSVEDSSSLEDDLDRVGTHAEVEQKLAGRHSSSSPPPAPPSVELMIDGIENDDGWMMVEDELLTTARRFTAHLHHAEYQRLKQLARSRPLGTLSRPTVGGTEEQARGSSRTKDRMYGKSDDMKSSLKNLATHTTASADEPLDEEELDPYNEDPLLAELMNGSEQLGERIGMQHDRLGDDQQVSAGVKRQRISLVLDAQSGDDSILNIEAKKRYEVSEATKSSSGYHKELGLTGNQQSMALDLGRKSPKDSKGRLLSAKVASKLAKRKVNDNNGDDDHKSHDKPKENTSSIADVPTFLL